jgi:A/G-specific adenine glycosylase
MPRHAEFARKLVAWQRRHGRHDLPWQRTRDPYRIWLAEVMLQQTQVAVVLPYYRRFVERWPTLERLAAARGDEVLAAWSGLGYYARCRSLLAAARQALRRHGGLPASLEELRALPGFGPYTAGAVASMAFAVPVPAVDGNAARVLARLFLVEREPSEGAARARTWALAGELVPASRPGDFNQALMELGATLCRKPAPACHLCPLARLCGARREGREAEIPPARQRAARTRLLLACAVVERRGTLLLARRQGRGLFGGLWELPSAEVGDMEEPAAELRSALRRMLGTPARVGGELARVERTLTHRDLTIAAYRCRPRGEPRARAGALRWAPPGELGRLGMATAMRKVLEAALARG